MNSDVVLSIFRLFKALPKAKTPQQNQQDLNKNAIEYGLFISPDVDFELIYKYNLIDEITSYGITSKQMNQCLHKSLAKVKNASDEELVFQQMLHYLTTYGVESLGFKTNEICEVYIPNEVLNIPENSDKVKITVIRAITDDEVIERVKALTDKNIAYSENVLHDLMILIKHYKIDLDVNKIPNKELRIRLCYELDKVPSNAFEFLRLMCYIITNKSLFIKDKDTLSKLVLCKKGLTCKDELVKINKLFKIYTETYGLKPLAEIFYQHKKIWLCLKNHDNAKIINKVRKLADKYKKPFKAGILDRITSELGVDISEVEKELEKVSLAKKVSLWNALAYRKDYPNSITYRIRNGKMYFKSLCRRRPAVFAFNARQVMDTVYNNIIESVKEHVQGKTVYIPDTIDYAFPTSEKDFISGIPCGTIAHLGTTATIGVWWENTKTNGGENRIDLDLHMFSQSSDYGWDARCRSDSREILFTGDMTNAPIGSGATECFYIGDTSECFSFNLNYFNYHDDYFNNHDNEELPVKYKLILDSTPKDVFNRDYIIDKQSVLTCLNMELTSQSQNIGILDCDDLMKDFIFYNLASGNGRTCSNNAEHKTMILNSLRMQSKTRLKLADVLRSAGAKVIDKYEENCIDLSFKGIAPTTIIELLYK